MSTEQEQIDKLTQTLKSEPVAASSGLTIQDHSLRNHLIVFQTEDGKTHQFLLSITYIGELTDGSYHHNSITECKDSGMHLASCDNDGYCNFCGHQY